VYAIRAGTEAQEADPGIPLHPTPHTLHPAPYTLHPTPYALQFTPYTVHPTPHTLHPTPFRGLGSPLQVTSPRDDI